MFDIWFLEEFQQFMYRGGWVVWLILIDCFFLLLLVVDRYYFALFGFLQLEKEIKHAWRKRTEHRSWRAQQIRTALLAQAKDQLSCHNTYIKMLIFICPLLGLLGTVSGMVTVFDVLALTGTGNARAMAAGIAKATIPTMVGMVVAIIGLFIQNQLNVLIEKRNRGLATLIPLQTIPYTTDIIR